MKFQSARTRLASAAMISMLAATASAQQVEQGQHARVDGVDIYYGMLPAPLVGKHPPTHEERAMHGGVSGRKNAHHLVVALFDSSGKRIADAQVQATVAELAMPGARKRLDPMSIDTAASYGGYFELPGEGPYRIAIEARLPGVSQPVAAQFEFRRR